MNSKELPYELIEKVSGGQQAVYKARDKSGRLVSVKAASKASLSPDMRERFLREVAVCSTFDHPNVLRIEDSGETGDTLYQVAEWLEGRTIAEVIQQKPPLTWDEKLSIMEQVCTGLEYAHSTGVLHRDVKPANIFLEKTGQVRLLDFGMARTAESNLTVAGLSPGTLTYMSPEQVRGEQANEASDVFCAGVVFYELATGIHPFATPQANIGNVLSAILFQSTTPLKQLATDAPEGLDIILNQMLEKDAARRYRSAGDVKQAISVCRSLKGRIEPKPDASKTVVIERPKIDAAPAARQQQFQRVTAPPPQARPQQRFCPHCTSPNKPDAIVCAVCAMPLGDDVKHVAESAKPVNWLLIAMIIAAILIAGALVLVLRSS